MCLLCERGRRSVSVGGPTWHQRAWLKPNYALLPHPEREEVDLRETVCGRTPPRSAGHANA